MMAASVFFFFELGNTSKDWRTSVLVFGIVTFIAAVHYYYLRDYNIETGGDSPVFFRNVDWLLTVPFCTFLLYSAFHFGQSDIQEWGIRSRRHLKSFFWVIGSCSNYCVTRQ